MESRTLELALASTRILSYSLIAFSIFFLAMCLGGWFEANILSSCEKGLGFELGRRDFLVRKLDTQVVAFVSMPVVLAAALGGLYEALWKLRETEGKATCKSWGNSAMNQFRTVLRFQFRPVIGSTVWISVAEFLLVLLWFVAMVAQMWQAIERNGLHYNERIHPCRDDPRRWCSKEDGHPMATPMQWRLRMFAVFFGFMASSHFAVILIPVSRDSTLWAAVGIPFERAVLYHKIAGHLAFLSVFLHALFFIVVWAWQEGWDHIFHRSMGYGEREHGGMSLPSGWMAFLCGIPMWITSVRYVRRRWYSLFKLAHWMFIGVLLFSVMHWAPNAAFLLGGLSLYSLHVYSRLTSWKRWRFWHRWSVPSTNVKVPITKTSVVSVHATDTCTRLVLRNPTNELPRGGAFVYISAPAALGTGEAHAFTVAYRGPPPGTALGANITPDNVHTLYVKSCGAWTKALALVARAAESSNLPESLLVDVDGFYHHVNSFKSMMLQGNSRIVLFAGGSGITSFMCYIQDWAAAVSSGEPVPDVRVLWSCRDLQEMHLVGEAIPSIISSVGSVHQSRLCLELYCSGKEARDSGDPSLTWPLYKVIHAKKCEKSAWAPLHNSFRILLVGAAAYGGWLAGQYESYRRDVRSSFHEGATTLTLMILSIAIALIGYRGACGLMRGRSLPGVSLKRLITPAGKSAQVGSAPEDHHLREEINRDQTARDAVGAITYAVTPGRIPVRGVLEHEAKNAEAKGVARVKVIVSGPAFFVDSVLLEARKINWRLFDTEVFSFEL